MKEGVERCGEINCCGWRNRKGKEMKNAFKNQLHSKYDTSQP